MITLKKIITFIEKITPEKYIFWVTLITLLALWVANLSNKLIMLTLFSLVFVFYMKTKDVITSALLTYLASTIVFSGKTYPQQIIPAGILPIEIYPQGFFINYTITPSFVIVCFLLLLIIRGVVNKKILKFRTTLLDIVLVIFYMWPIFSDLLASKDPEFSLLFSLTSTATLILYFYIRVYSHQIKNILKYYISAISALVVFESLISFQQFLIKSPVFKNLEYMVNIEYFGNATDEILFAFRPLGTFPHANALGVWLASFSIIVLLILVIKPGLNYFILFAIGFLTLLMTLSRSSWLGFLIGTLACLLILEKIKKVRFSKLTNKYIGAFWIGIPILAFIFVIPRLEKSAYTFSSGGGYFREIQIRRAIETISTNPIFGIGSSRSVQEGLASVNRDENTSIVQNVHNWYILNSIEHGLTYVLLFSLIILLYFKSFIKRVKIMTIPLTNINAIIQLGLFGGMISNLITGVFQPFMSLHMIIITLALSEID